jgi:hypothetical protein
VRYSLIPVAVVVAAILEVVVMVMITKPYVLLLCLAAEIMTYPSPTANPNASGIKTAPASQLNVC